MADATVSFAVENIGNLIQEGKFLSAVRDQVEEMQIELEWMQCFLKDAERRKGESHRVRNWVSQIREATYDVEDLIERFVLKSALRNQKGVVNRIKKYAFFINHIVELHQVGSRIEAIKARLTTLRTRLQIYGIIEFKVGAAANGASATGRRKRQDYSHVVDYNVVGLKEKINELVERLIHVGDHDDRSASTSVVCLHGMGGVGKTTTARKVYGDSTIKRHFEGFAWVYISQQFNPRQVWESILTQLSGNRKNLKSMSDDELMSQICHLQKEKKCLLVIDDIWRKEDWVKLSAAFPYEDRGSKSKMLLTTRNEGVVSNTVNVYPTSLNVLDHANSVDLLTNTILFLGGPNHPIKEDTKMKKCAGDMVKQCGGLPLAIIVLGGILATKHELKKWERVGANFKSVLKRGEQEGNDEVMSVLESSYEELSYNLRSCFLYFSQYPEDEEIKTTELMQRWIGEGFVSSSVEEGDETIEDVAEKYLYELVRRCMIQVVSRGHTGRVKTCRMHDLMRELCISKAKEEGFAHSIKLGVENEGTVFKNIGFRRLCISSGNQKSGESVLSSLGKIPPHLRSIWFQDNLDNNQCKEAVLKVKKLKLVRVLLLPRTMWTLMGKEVGNLIHLRFLDLEVSMLPTSIGNLRCLQTLNLGRCDSNLIIPDSVWGMEQLRHLYLPVEGGVCESRKQHVSHFKNLQTLVNFPPENFDLQNNLVKFIKVRKLIIITKRCEEICKKFKSRGIVFKRLESLSFTNSSQNVDLEAVTRGCPSLYRLVVSAPVAAPGCSVFWPSNLTKLVLRHSRLDESHMGSLGELQSLKALFLCSNAFRGKKMIFLKRDFPQLCHLLLEELVDLETWVVHEKALPSLSCLEIVNCQELKSVPDGFQYLKQLKELKVRSMPYSFRMRLEEGGRDWDKVSHVPSISFSNCYLEEHDDHILDEDSSFELLINRILCLGGFDHPITENSKMRTSATEMVKICGGVRLAITVLGGILATKHEISEWERIESVLKEGERKGNGVTSVLELRYEDLPCNLKPCFLYFSQYLKGEEIKTTEMIKRWIGEGFVPDGGFVTGETMEDVGMEYLNELVSRGLVEVGKTSCTGRVKTCRVHYFVWYFCVSKANEKGFAHSLRLGVGDEWTILDKIKVGMLSFMSSLLILNLERCDSGLTIPDSVWMMEQLRHLYLPPHSECESSKQRVGDLRNLQTLVNFPPANFDLQQNLARFSSVKKMVIISRREQMGRILRSQEIVFNRLQSLSLKRHYDKVDLAAFTRACPCLYRLVVDGSNKCPTPPSCSAIWPSNLTKLVLKQAEIDESQFGSLAKLQSLKVLFLYVNAFTGKEMVFHKNGFPQLGHLILEKLFYLETWVVEEGALPSLFCLEISYCGKLESIGDGAQYLEQLKELKVTKMPDSFRKKLERGGEDWDRVKHVHSISL